MQNQVNSKVSAVVSLDDSILRFWNDFVSKQIGAGRRDVGRMLEVALEFYFDRSTQASATEVSRRQALDTFARHVRQEIEKVEHLLDAADMEAGLAAYRGLQITVRTDGALTPVETKPYPSAFASVEDVQTYHAMLVKQAAAAQQVIQLITDKLVRQRRLTAQRLKDLSPLLYQQGVRMVAQAESASSAHSATVEQTPTESQIETTSEEPASVWGMVKRVVANMQARPAGAKDPPPEESLDLDTKLRAYQEMAAKWSKER